MSQVADTETTTDDGEPLLTPKLGTLGASKLWHLPVIAVWGLLFLLFNYLPLRPNDLWVHVEWGQWMLDHWRIPSQDPFQPLAAGMPVVDRSAWLAQVIFGAVDRYGGPQWLSNMFALVSLVSWLIVWRTLPLAAGRQARAC